MAWLLWTHANDDERAAQGIEGFTTDLKAWWRRHHDSHVAFLAITADARTVGMAWLALLSRTPRPGRVDRLSADIQTVFVLPEHRGTGVGSRLIEAAIDHGRQLGVDRITVNSGRRATPLYERLGFSSSPQLLQMPTH